MKWTICLMVLFSALLAQAEQGPARKKAGSAKKAAPPAEIVIPEGATQTEPGTYTYTDKQGKKWTYRKTPFGIARAEDKPAAAPAVPAAANITAAEDGDTVRFERPGPFGPYRWQKKKSELTEDERAALEKSRGQADAAKAKQE
ncbi:MAG TPA: hypothetical protein VL285_26510 [Bryobacteraceae bacterium]|nr:hypothetical protein [Bryobacteraceae bacterium]